MQAKSPAGRKSLVSGAQVKKNLKGGPPSKSPTSGRKSDAGSDFGDQVEMRRRKTTAVSKIGKGTKYATTK